jgi:hypothetical protein
MLEPGSVTGDSSADGSEVDGATSVAGGGGADTPDTTAPSRSVTGEDGAAGAGSSEVEAGGAAGASGVEAGAADVGAGVGSAGVAAEGVGAAEVDDSDGSAGAAGVGSGAGAAGAGVGAGALGAAAAAGVGAGALGVAGAGAAGDVTADTACVTGAAAGATDVTASVAAGTACDSDSVTGVCGTGNGSCAMAGEALKTARMRASRKVTLRGVGVSRDARAAPADPSFLLNYPSGDVPLGSLRTDCVKKFCEFGTREANFSRKHEMALMSQFAGFSSPRSVGNSDLSAHVGARAGRNQVVTAT